MNEGIEFTKENLLIGLDCRIEQFKKELEAIEGDSDYPKGIAWNGNIHRCQVGWAMYTALIDELNAWKKFVIEAQEVQNG
jgi:hypothetical protein